MLATEAILGATTSDLMAARQQMAFTLGIHIVLASLGVSFPAITLIANYRALRRGDADALLLARRWSKVMAVLFAVGAVTGTVLSFELGLLWPGLMGQYGDVFGIPFAIEGLFFFTEAIFIAIYIYGWDRLRPWPHFWTGVPIAVAGVGGTFAVIAANSWMNQPAGFRQLPDGTITDINPWAAIFNDATWYEVPHMLLAAYAIGGFLVASVYAVAMLKGRRDRYHRLGLLIPLTVGALVIPVQIVVGDFAARAVFENQPVKFAAMELVQETDSNVPLTLGGVIIDGEVRGALEIPGMGSFLAGRSTDTVVPGLNEVPPEDRPPANIVHLAFDLMVAIGTALLLLAIWFGIVWWRRRDLPRTPWFLRAVAISGVAAIAATEAGWVVTEVGRQPWVVFQHLRTVDAVTTTGGLWWSFAMVLVLYVAVITAAVVVLLRMARRWRGEREVAVPYGPGPGPTADEADVDDGVPS